MFQYCNEREGGGERKKRERKTKGERKEKREKVKIVVKRKEMGNRIEKCDYFIRKSIKWKHSFIYYIQCCHSNSGH